MGAFSGGAMGTKIRILHSAFLIVAIMISMTACLISPNISNGTSQLNAKPSGQVENLFSANQAGLTRKDPIPMGTQVSIPGWDVEVRQFLRGEEALKVINTASWQAEPLPDGQEYVLAKVFVRNTSMDENYHDLGISQMFITGDQYLAHGDTMDGWPQPEFLFEDMYTAEAVEGWVDGVVPIDEKNLELVLDVKDDNGRYTRFFALDKGASISLPTDVVNMNPNEKGKTIDTPAKMGEEVITTDWAITPLEIIRGLEAEAILQKDNPNYEAPQTGTERALLKLNIKYINPEELPAWIGADQFRGLDPSGNTVQGNLINTPQDRNWIANAVLPGAEMEGWVAVTVPDTGSEKFVEFYPSGNSNGSLDQNIFYFSLK
jgi:hypothetical protein